MNVVLDFFEFFSPLSHGKCLSSHECCASGKTPFICVRVLNRYLLSAGFVHLACVLFLRNFEVCISESHYIISNTFVLPRSMSPNLSNRSSPLTFNVVNHSSGTDCPDPFANGADVQVSNLDYRLSRKELQQNLQENFSRHGKVKSKISSVNVVCSTSLCSYRCISGLE